MITQQNQQDTPESRLKEAQVENELLLVQIHQLEEELEHYFKRNQDLERVQQTGSPGNDAVKVDWVDDELPDAIAENQRLQALVKVLRKAHQLEAQNALNVKLGNILIQGVDSPAKLLAVPGKIGKIWRDSSRKKPPNALGGKGFDKVIGEYSEGGFKTVEKLLAGLSLVPGVQANAYTALGRHVMNSDSTAAAEAARRAYAVDPQPFRLKWLAFRLHEAGNVIEAEAMLDVLPDAIKFSESEARQASQLRNEAKHVRLHEAERKSGFYERRVEFEQWTRERTEVEEKLGQEIEKLNHAKEQEEEENELLLHQLFQTQEDLESQYAKYQTLEQANEQLEQEKAELAGEKDEQAKLASDRQSQVDQLIRERTEVEEKLGQEIEKLNHAKEQEEEDNELLQHQLFQTQEDLESQYAKYQKLEQANEQLEQEKAELAEEKDEQVKLASDRQSQVEQLIRDRIEVEERLGQKIEKLNHAKEQLEQEKAELAGEKDEQVKLASDRQSQVEQVTRDRIEVEEKLGQEIEKLNQAKEQLEQEKAELAEEKNEQVKLASDRQSLVEQLTRDRIEVEEKLGLENEKLNHAREQLEQEKAELAGQKDVLAKIASDRQSQVEQLIRDKAEVETNLVREIDAQKQVQAKLEQEKAELAGEKDEQAKLASDRQSQVEQLTRDKAEVETNLVREIDALKQVQAKLEQEKAKLAGQKDEQSKLVAEWHKKIDELQQQVQVKQDSEAELLSRQNMMQEEMVRAEAQLDLIKDMLLREPEL